MRESLHYDRPITPLHATVVIPATEAGLDAAARQRGAPRGPVELRVVDHHVYARPTGAAEPDGAPTQELTELVERWTRTSLPSILAGHETLRALCTSPSPRRLAADLDRAERELERQFAVLFDILHHSGAAMRVLEAMLTDAGEPHPARTVAELLAPLPCRLRDIDARLAKLAERAPPLPADARAALDALDVPGAAGDAFRAVWRDVADRPGALDIGAPTWREDPTPLVRALRDGRSASEAFDAGEARAIKRRDEARARVIARFPAEAAPQVDAVLDLLRRARSLAQDHNHLSGEISLGLIRNAYLRTGARLVAEGILSHPTDIRFLTRDDVRTALLDGVLPRGLVAARIASFRAASTREPDADATGTDATMLGARAAGDMPALGASSGRARGRTRVVTSEDDIDAVAPGDVLVLVALPPAWTSVMGRAAAVITEAGGMLCHAAIVAREMGLPAVVGLPDAMKRFPTGTLIEVDGDAGTVRSLEK